jgi:8-hydroxy-5-deazaflavin:NADPH oxidoreductase
VKIGIIGAGNIGGTLTRKLAAAGHAIKLAGSKGADAVREQAEAVGAEPVVAADVVKDVDVVILSIPFAALPDVAGLYAAVPVEMVVIDTSNYYPQRDGRIAAVEEGQPESPWGSEMLGRPVVKAFNTALARTLAERGRAPGAEGRIAQPVAGDDARGRALAAEVVDAAVFDAVGAGDLAASWR